ncbi:MAG: hypothetical protein D6725_14675 [Planctomycetota bacterium]|nr:MAG: hypothetical protein D6725_14675 [Planctomycetota bacterium]
MLPGVRIAATPPTIDFAYYPEQRYPGHPWSVWGDGSTNGNEYYSAIGDHGAPQGRALVFAYDADRRSFRLLADTAALLRQPPGHYMPGKIHTRVDRGSDGWLYFGTHRGSTRVTTDAYHYRGDWILRAHPKDGRAEIVVHAPVPRACIPTGLLDPQRLIFYGGTAAADYRDKTVTFFAYDLRNRRLLATATPGPRRYLMFARSTGRVYWMDEENDRLMRFDPESGEPPRPLPVRLGLRAATAETPDGFIYTVGQRDAHIWRFDTANETVLDLGPLAVVSQTYTTSIDADPSGRYLYYVPGAHGGAVRDGSPVVQFDTRTRTRKVIAFLHPYYRDKYGYAPLGTYSTALSADGTRLFITWNGSRGEPVRGRYRFDTCALTVVHIPAAERPLDPQ